MPCHTRFAIAALLLALSSAPSLHAQTPTCTPGSVPFAYGIYQPYARTPQPYSETIRSTSEQHLADGNTIRGMAVVHAYRDSTGRTRTEHIDECFLGKDGQMHSVLRIQIYDPTNSVNTSWSVGRPGHKIAIVSRYISLPSQRPTPEEQAEEGAWYQLRVNITTEPSKREDLGKRTFFGMEAKDTRTTQTTPAGAYGNDASITSTEETWSVSPGGVMLRTQEDPRFGKHTTEVTEFTPGEPDASLFVQPADYQIVEQKTKTVATPPAAKQ